MVTVDPATNPSAQRLSPTDVAIVGAGPVGLCAAILLAARGMRTVVIERHREPYPQPRAVHLDDEVLRILDRAGIRERFRGISRPGRGLRLVDRDLHAFATFTRAEETDAALPASNMFNQPDLERLLRARVAELPEIQLLSACDYLDHTQDPDGVSVRVRRTEDREDLTIDARYLIGCDGARSTVRPRIGGSLVDLGFDQRWVVLDVDVDGEVASWGGVDQVFDRYRPGTYMQITDVRHRWEFRLRDGEKGSDFATPGAVRDLIRPWLVDPGRAEVEIVRCAEYEFRAMSSDRWRAGRVFIAGDAAHVTPPFIGQGLGTGLRDVANLAWKLQAHITGAADDILDSYQREREPHARSLIRRAIMIGRAMTDQSWRARALRAVILPRVRLVPGLGTIATSSVTPRLGPSSLTWGPRSGRRGMLFPYELHAQARSIGCLVETTGRPDPHLERMARRLGLAWESGWRGPAPAELRRWCARARFVLVRPDGTVAAAHRTARAMSRSLLRYADAVAPAALSGSAAAGGTRSSAHRPRPHRTHAAVVRTAR